jgi:tetratricopeptide (TPR) repeat protein
LDRTRQLAHHLAAGSETLGDALLLGLEDAKIWSRIGTLYLDFAKDSSQAIVFYDQAIHIDPRSPMYHYNKARALAYGKRDYVSARYRLAQSRRLVKNMWGWFKVNEDQFIELERAIAKNTDATLPPMNGRGDR